MSRLTITFKPMTYFVSFISFVVTFFILGLVWGASKVQDYRMVQAYTQAVSLKPFVQPDAFPRLLRWEQDLAAGSVHLSATNQPASLALVRPGAAPQALALDTQGRLRDLRVGGDVLYARVGLSSPLRPEETDFLQIWDLRSGKPLRQMRTSPGLLPPPPGV
jgi:hypothetical protein